MIDITVGAVWLAGNQSPVTVRGLCSVREGRGTPERAILWETASGKLQWAPEPIFRKQFKPEVGR